MGGHWTASNRKSWRLLTWLAVACVTSQWSVADGDEGNSQLLLSDLVQGPLREEAVVVNRLLGRMQAQVDDGEATTYNTSVKEVLFEGDIMLTAPQAQHLLASPSSPTPYRHRGKRKITTVEERRWPLPIPFRFNPSPKYALDPRQKKAVREAIAELSSQTCIRFKEVTSGVKGQTVLDFRRDVGCWSYIGRIKWFRYQEISVDKHCFQRGILLHELGHAIGFWHEQARPDRDDYVTYMPRNVRRGEEFNFKRESWGDIENMGVPYDVGSIMHYGSNYFSKSGKITLKANDPLMQRDLGQRTAMTFYDVKLANLAYCKVACPKAKFSCQHDGYPDPNNCQQCRCPDGLTGSTCQHPAPSTGQKCGGRLLIHNGSRYRLQSPGFPWAYMANTQCYWQLEANSGWQIHLEVRPNNFMSHPDCPTSQLTPCQDYLEVKYNLSFGNTGARFCCGQPPVQPVVSRGQTMLVLFRTWRTGIGGFQATVHTEPCGGCYRSSSPQRPCILTKAVTCLQQWQKMEHAPCPPPQRPNTYGCDQFRSKTFSRDSTCQVEMEHCCQGYKVKDGFCVAQITEKDKELPLDTTTGSDLPVSEEVTLQPETGWGSWQPWTECSKTCGGCGTRNRIRRCLTPKECRGQRSDRQSQVCQTQPCPNLQAYACPTTRTETYNCGWLTRCTRQVTEQRQCLTKCCPHYKDKGGICQPVLPQGTG